MGAMDIQALLDLLLIKENMDFPVYFALSILLNKIIYYPCGHPWRCHGLNYQALTRATFQKCIFWRNISPTLKNSIAHGTTMGTNDEKHH